MRSLLKGVKWEDFYGSINGNLPIDDHPHLFSLRVGKFFHIPAVAIICNKRYAVLRKLQMKHWDQFKVERFHEAVGKPGFAFSYWMKDENLNGNWYMPTHNGIYPGVAAIEIQEKDTGIYREAYVLERSKFDLLRAPQHKAKRK